jgi:hypothetical protein
MTDDPFGFPEEIPISELGRAAQRLLAAKDNITPSEKSERSRKAKATRAMGKDLEKRTVAYYQSLGYLAFSVGYTTQNSFGKSFSKDLLGVADCMAIRKHKVLGLASAIDGAWSGLLGRLQAGVTILIQSTTEGDVRKHELKYLNPKTFDVRTGKTAYQNLMEWYDQGGEFEMCVWSKNESGRWQCRVQSYSQSWFRERWEAKNK